MSEQGGDIWVIVERGHRSHEWLPTLGTYPSKTRRGLKTQLEAERVRFPLWFFKATRYIPAPTKKRRKGKQ